MPEEEADPPHIENAEASRLRLSQWSRTAVALALLFGTLPLASKLFVGEWGFTGSSELGCLCLVAAFYFHFRAKSGSNAIPDTAILLDRAIQLASEGQVAEAIQLLSDAIRLSPHLWQAFQYRGELRLRQPETLQAALGDFQAAIEIAPREAHLYRLRAQVRALLGDEVAAREDLERAAVLSGVADQ